jgi:hypothetical protein
MNVGEILRNPQHYLDPQTGEFKTKYLLVLSHTKGLDLIVRLLTSRQNARPEDPQCSHADPYPAFFLGVLGGRFQKKSWLDLRHHPDLDSADVAKKLKSGSMEIVAGLTLEMLMPAMECTAAAPDTTREQEVCIRDSLSKLRPQRSR